MTQARRTQRNMAKDQCYCIKIKDQGMKCTIYMALSDKTGGFSSDTHVGCCSFPPLKFLSDSILIAMSRQ
jgi:hypothetical protein